MKKSFLFNGQNQGLIRINFIFILITFCLQFNFAQLQVNLSGGIAGGYSPNLVYEETDSKTHEGKGNTISIFGEILLQKKWIGRLQLVNLIPSTYTGDFESNFKSGRSFTGSLGILLGNPESKLRFPAMVSSGFSIITYEANGDDYSDGGGQIGITAGPQYQITKHLFALAEIRYLKGFKSSSESGPVGQTDFLIGLKIML